MNHPHVPVLLEEVRHLLQPAPGRVYVDGTLGVGGHAAMLLEHSAPNGIIVGIERDPRNLEAAKRRLEPFGKRAILTHGNYRDLTAILQAHHIGPVDGILLDLGFSSLHVDDPTRGFSFQHDGPLDMRYDIGEGESASHIVNQWREEELAELFRRFGEEPAARKIAHAIVVARKKKLFERTLEFAAAIESIVPRRGRIHPATRVFQALRIAVNDELGALKAFLPDAVQALKPNGRLAIISFHSLEDRIVKQFIRNTQNLAAVTKRPVTAGQDEVRKNPRARSAKLRTAERTDKHQPYVRDHAYPPALARRSSRRASSARAL